MFSKNNISLYETVNKDRAIMCSKLSFEQFKILFNLSTTKRHDDYDIMGEYKKLINYSNEIIKSNNKKKVNYGYVEGKDIGRLQSKNCSIQRLYNGFRGILCDGGMIDFDMKNCHPCILLNLCKKYNIKYNYLLDYINNRESFLNDVMKKYKLSRSMAKSEILKILNKEPITTKLNNIEIKENSKFKKLDLELSNILNELFNIYQNDEKYNKYINNKEWNYKGKFMNLILCDIECEYLIRGINCLINKKILNKDSIAVLMFDGFMCYDNNYNYNEMINILNNEFEEEGIQWDIKPHNIELLEDLNKMIISNIDYYESNDIIDLIDYILNGVLKDKLIKCEDNIYYMGNEKIIHNEKNIKMELYKFISNQKYFINDDKKKIEVSKIHNHIKNIVEGLINKCDYNQNFNIDVWNYTQYKIFFKNGYYDYKLNKFIEGSFNKTFIKINKNYIKSNNQKLREEINKKIFYPIFTINEDSEDKKERLELLEYFKYMIGQYIAGNITMKRWFMLQGMRNSGKGILGDLLKNCFEKYVMTTNSNNFNYKSMNNDSQKALSWLMDYEYIRLALSSEVTINEDIKFDGNMLKKFSSGGDYISARKNFQDEREFKIQASLIVFCNDCPKIEPSDALEYCDEFQMKSKFIDDNFNEDEKFEGYSYYKKDDSLKSEFLLRDDIIMELINIFIESFYNNCNYPENLRKDIEDNLDNDYLILKELFEITKNREDFIDNKSLKDILKNADVKFSLKKSKILLKAQGAAEFKHKTGRGLCYIKLKEEYIIDDL